MIYESYPVAQNWLYQDPMCSRKTELHVYTCTTYKNRAKLNTLIRWKFHY